MRRLERRRAGFSLIELMITIAIVGILATIAIPSFQRLQLRSKSSEGRTNLAGIRTSELGYFVEFGTYVGAAATPAVLPGASKVAWPVASPFDVLGWQPAGTVQFQYSVIVPAGGGSALVFTAEAVSDLDADAAPSAFGFVKSHPNGGPTVAGAFCPDTGVWDPILAANALFDTVGPCNANAGINVF